MRGDGGPNLLYRNTGNLVFEEAAAEAGVAFTKSAVENYRHSSPAFADLDGDNDLDLLLPGLDGDPTLLFANNGDGTFSNVTDYDVIIDGNGMGSAVGDFDGDGDLDWFVSSIRAVGEDVPSHLSRVGNRLYRNDEGTFADVTAEAGVADGGWGWGSCFLDFENDGDLDIYHTNGWQEWDEFGGFNTDTSKAFVSNGDGTFTESAEELGLDDPEQGRGIVCADFDNDGDTDILQLHMHADNAATLWMNQATNNWLSVRLRGAAPNTQAIGARIVASIAGDDHLREVTLGSNFASHNPTDQLFGLGSMAQVDTLTVEWPDGEPTVMQSLAVNQELVIDHPQRCTTPGRSTRIRQTTTFSAGRSVDSVATWKTSLGRATFGPPARKP